MNLRSEHLWDGIDWIAAELGMSVSALAHEVGLNPTTFNKSKRVRPDGSRSATSGASPKGIAFFDAGGYYIISVMRSDRPRYAINNFAEGTAEENKATAQGVITYFGTYSVSEADRTIAIHIEGSSFPNWNGADQKRILTITGDELKLASPAATGAGTAEVVWKRAK